MISRVIIIGDVHGCLTELRQLIDKVGYDQSKDRLVFVGDLVDRGPDSLGVIKLIRELKAECTVGNHDERYIRYRKHMLKKVEDPKYIIPMKELYKDRLDMLNTLSDEDWEWLVSLPIYIRILENWVVIHAGLEPGRTIEEQDPGVILHGRYLRKSNKRMERSLANISIEDACFWTEMWDGPENIVYGHMVTPTRMPHIDISAGGALCVGIDTGCCFGHSLTAMILDSEGRSFSFMSVQAQRAHEELEGYLAATTLS